MPPSACETRESASLVLERLLLALPQERVSLGWLHGQLREHSFEMMAFIMALIGVLPGASIMAGLLLIVPACGMLFASGMTLPLMVAERSIPTRQASFLIGRAIPVLRFWEMTPHMRHASAARLARPVAGALILLLTLTLFVPVPLSNVPPALAIAGLSLAAFEGSLALLCLSCLAAMGSLAFTAVTIIAASQAFVHFGL